MASIRWEPARELSTIQQELNRLFVTAFDVQAGAGNGARPVRWVPAMDLVENGDHFILRADLPGLAEDAVSVEVEDNVLTISGNRKSEHEDRKDGYHRIERAYGGFSRSLTLPSGVDVEFIEASFKDGVLEVRVPKPEQAKPRRVAINGGDTQRVVEGAAS